MESTHERPPAPLGPRGLILCALWACAGVLAVRAGGPLAVGACGVAVAAHCLRAGRAGPIVLMLPAALGALHPVQPAATIPPGPVRIEAEVIARPRRSFDAGRLLCPCRQRGAEIVIVVDDVDRPGAILPGDRLEGTGFAPAARPRTKPGPPRIETNLGAVRVTPGGPTPARLAAATCARLERALREHVPGPPGLLLCHLVLGGGPRLPDEVVEAHRASGLAHLLAVSGAHASLLAWMLAIAFRLLRGSSPWEARGYRRFCAVFLCSYGAITGLEPPVFRALAAWCVVAWAGQRGRRPTIGAALALPALLTALCAPDDLFSVGFCLSYAAVVGLSAAATVDALRPTAIDWKTALRASAWATLTTAPLTLWWFGQLAPWTIVATPILAPFVAAMLALGVLTALLGVAVPALASLLAVPLATLAGTYTDVVLLVAELPAAPIHAPYRADAWVLAACLVAGVVPLVLLPSRRRLAGLCALLCVPHFVPLGARDQPTCALLDVGHGQACLVSLPCGRNALIDCGSRGSAARAGAAVLRALPRRRRIDVLILSHGDADHDGGVLALTTRVAIGTAIVPDYLRGDPTVLRLEQRGVPVRRLADGETAEVLPGVTVAAPDLGRRATSNDRSLWVRVTAGGIAVLLPGDAEAAGIRAMLRREVSAPADVLVLPHHARGEAEPVRRLLARVSPSAALVSGGWTPVAPPLVTVARAHGIPVVETATRGTVRVALDGSATVEADRPARLAPGGAR